MLTLTERLAICFIIIFVGRNFLYLAKLLLLSFVASHTCTEGMDCSKTDGKEKINAVGGSVMWSVFLTKSKLMMPQTRNKARFSLTFVRAISPGS